MFEYALLAAEGEGRGGGAVVGDRRGNQGKRRKPAAEGGGKRRPAASEPSPLPLCRANPATSSNSPSSALGFSFPPGVTVPSLSPLPHRNHRLPLPHRSHRNIDDIEDAIEEANEQRENMKLIQEALATPIGASADFDEDELEAELEGTEVEELDQELPEPPARTCVEQHHQHLLHLLNQPMSWLN